MPNQTLVAIPPKIDNPKDLRTFLIRLVERLDVVLGFRGNEGYSTIEQSANLAGQIKEVRDNLATAVKDLDSRVTSNTDAIDTLTPGTEVASLSLTAVAPSASYTQSEAEEVANQVKAVADKVDEILTVLNSATITKAPTP